jgi:Protein of unknown function (DUF2442)
MIDVVKLKALPEFRLAVVFSDGTGGDYDASAMVAEGGHMVAPLRDPAYFGRAFVEVGAPTWPNGFDIAPQWLQQEMRAAGALLAIADAA